MCNSIHTLASWPAPQHPTGGSSQGPYTAGNPCSELNYAIAIPGSFHTIQEPVTLSVRARGLTPRLMILFILGVCSHQVTGRVHTHSFHTRAGTPAPCTRVRGSGKQLIRFKMPPSNKPGIKFLALPSDVKIWFSFSKILITKFPQQPSITSNFNSHLLNSSEICLQ